MSEYRRHKFEFAREALRQWLATFGVDFVEVDADGENIKWEIIGGKRPVTVRLEWYQKDSYYQPKKRFDYIVQIGSLKPKRIIDAEKAAEIIGVEVKTIRKRRKDELWNLEDYEMFVKNLEKALDRCEYDSKIYWELSRQHGKISHRRDVVKEAGRPIKFI